MELTLDSAFSTGGLVGHLSYMLLVASMVMRVMWALRVLVIASAFVAIAYDLIWLKDPIGVFWETMLVIVNIAQLCILGLKNRFEKFNGVEAAFVNAAFPGLSNALKRKIIRKGAWHTAGAGTVFTTEGVPVEKLIFVSQGTVDVTMNGSNVGACGPGDFVGEITVMAEGPATGTAVSRGTTSYWAIPGHDLRALVASDEDISQAMQASFHKNMLSKLVAANAQLGRVGGFVPV